LGWLKRGFFANRITKYGLNVLIPALIWFPMMVPKAFVDRMNIKLVKKCLVGIDLFCCGLHYCDLILTIGK
jgi:hypothetical protein